LEYYNQLINEYTYFNAMKPRHRSSIQREINEVLFQLEEMNMLMERYEQEELMLELGLSPEGIYSSPVPVQ